MIKLYNTNLETNKLESVDTYTRGTWIHMVDPSEEEIKEVCQNVNIKEDFIRYALDNEEKARIDVEDEDDTILFIIDIPVTEKSQSGGYMYATMPIGMIVVRDDFFITVTLRECSLIKKFETGKVKSFCTYKKSRFILQMMYNNSSDYLEYLKKINKETEIAENVLKNSMKNRELLKLLSLEKSLVYITTSLRSNEAVMERTLKIKNIKLYDEDEDILEDAIIENKQAIEMSKVYSDILNGTMDAYASIISNNLNGVMKSLTSITIIIAVPTMIASFWGMNVKLPFEGNILGFWIMIFIATLLTIISVVWLKKNDMLN